jgi:hypothetical protein
MTEAPAGAGGPARTGFEGVPEQIVDLCRSLTDFVERAVGIRPDYTPETLPLVDHYVREARGVVAERPELLDLSAQAVGAYFGEVVRRHLVGFWSVPSPNLHDWQVCGEAAFVAINPIGVGYDALAQGSEHGGPSSQVKLAAEDRALVEARLAELPVVREDDYYLLSLRYEVLELTMEAVRAQATERGYGDTTYTVEDYAPLPPQATLH